MDGLLEELGGQRVKTPVEEAWHREQERRKYDIIRVKYPTTATVKGREYQLPQVDFYLEYDTNQYQRIVYGSEIDIPRYMAIRYVEHKKDDIVNYVNKVLHDAFIAERDVKGLPRYIDKSTENKDTYETQDYPKTNDPEVVAELYEQLWMGVAHKFGQDIPPQNINPRSGEVNIQPVSMQVLDKMNTKRVTPLANTPYQPGIAPQVQPTQTIPQQPSGFAVMNQRLDPSEVTA